MLALTYCEWTGNQSERIGMSRESRIIREHINSDRIVNPVLTTDHVEYIKNVLIDSLRDVFSRDPVYTYIQDPATGEPMWQDPGNQAEGINPNLGIVIRDVYDYEVEFLPALTIRVNGGNVTDVSFNQNQFTYDYQRDENGEYVRDSFGRPIPIYQEFSGIYTTTAVVFIHTFDTLSREELVSRVAILFKHVLRDQLTADFGLFIQGVSVGGETESPYQEGNDMIYTQSVNLEILTGWNNRIPVGPELEAVNLQIVGDGVTPSDSQRATPIKKDVENSNRIDWIDETRTCPELALADALEFEEDGYGLELKVTRDWIEILSRYCGVTIEEAIQQINSPSNLRRILEQTADKLRQKAIGRRKNKHQAIRTGSPSVGFTYRFSDGVIVLPNDTVVFQNNIRVTSVNSVVTSMGIVVNAASEITLPTNGENSNIDLDLYADPFTATTLEDLTAWNFFLILLFVNSTARQSIMSLNRLIDDYLATLTDSAQITFVENLRDEIVNLSEHRFLLWKVYADIGLNLQ